MPTASKLEQWNTEVLAFLERQYPAAPNYKASLVSLWENYLALGLPNAHFVSEFTGGKKEIIFQRAWEMMLARHLDDQGYHLTTLDVGPDFRFEHDGLVVWVEAISPEPKGLPVDWMTAPKPDEFKTGDFPHNEILLRWTAAIKEKREKLLDYRKKGIVAEDDAYVIAVNGCQLGALPVNHGITRYPFAVEAVYPVGALAYHIDKATGKITKAVVTQRLTIQNANGAPVATTIFADPVHSGVSAIIACTMDRSDEASLPVDVIHNHYAKVRIPEHIFGSNGEEWVTDTVGTTGEEIDLRRLD